MSTLPSSTPRRVPPPCWTQDETLALIQAYRDKWFSVNRGNLRAADWDAVAAAVSESSSADPPKSALQCRHKIEKLRKRYRTEKQRCVNFQGRFFSSWDLFPLLDAMSIGSSAGSKQCQDIDERNEIGDGFRVKSFGDRYSKICSSVDEDVDTDSDVGLDRDLIFRARKFSRVDGDSETKTATALLPKPVVDMNSVSVAFGPKDYGRIEGKIKPESDFHCEYGNGVYLKAEDTQKDRSFMPQIPRLKGYVKISNDSMPDDGNFSGGLGEYVGFPLRTLGDVPQGYKPRIYRKNDKKSSPGFVKDVRGRGDYWESQPSGFREKNSRKVEVDSKVSNGIGNGKKSGIDRSTKKEMDPIKELVSAISLSTNTFVKVEKMKMEMAMEIEKMRMDMMLKHNQMILESQHQIVDAFAKTASENKRKGTEVLSPCRSKNGVDSQVNN